MEIRITVATPNKKIEFHCVAHQSTRKEDLLIEPEFYARFATTGVPKGDHFELELTETPWLPQGLNSIHIHLSTYSNRNFVCWPNEMPTIEMAVEVFRVWCVGTTYTLIHGKDFVSLFDGDLSKFLRTMEQTYKIQIE